MKKGIKKIEDFAHLGKADIHIHSNHSDGRPSVEQILDYVEEHTDLNVIAITDHDEISGALEAMEIMSKKKYRFDLIIGEEVSTLQGHILALFIKEKIRSGMTAHNTLKEIRRQGGVGIASHPFEHLRYREPNGLTMDGVGLMTLIQEKKLLHGIEVVNATPTLGEENYRAEFINRTMLLKAETGSSDAHIVEAIGKGYTLFEGKSANDLRMALAHHQTQAMYAKWTLFALFKYLFFFIPIGLRMFFFTMLHGRSEKKVDIINVPKDFR
jgi:predicted metal-dependent phosphoesterase TrpH